MKKIISLALAGSMLLSFATTGSAASTAIDTPMTSGTIGGGWVVSNQTITDTDIASFQLSDDNAYSLPYSLKLTHGTQTDTEHKIGIKIPVTLESGAKYKVRFKSTEPMRSTVLNQKLAFSNGFGYVSGVTKQYSSVDCSKNNIGDSGWYQNEFYYNAQGRELYLWLNALASAFTARYFDDFEIYKVTTDDDENEVLTPVEIADASFDATAPATGTDVTDSVTTGYVNFDGWAQTFKKGTQGRTRAIDVGTEGATGRYSARLVYEGASESDSYIQLWRNNFLQGNNAKSDKYRVEFKAKGSTSDFWVGFGGSYSGAVNVTKAFNGTGTVDNVTVEEIDNGWKKMTIICDGTTTELKDIALKFQTNASTDLLIDDVSVYNMTDSVNVTVSNNSFELFDFDNWYDINSPIAQSSFNRIKISWYNPRSKDLTDVQILENGAEIAESAAKTDWVLTKQKVSSIEVPNLTKGDTHTYTIRAYTSDTEYTDHTVTATVMGDRWYYPATLTDGNYAEDWGITYSGGAVAKGSPAMTGLYLDDKIRYSGDYALRVEINEHATDNSYVEISKTFNAEVGKTYRITYMGKGASVGSADAVYFYNTGVNSWSGTKITKGTTEWTEYGRNYTATATGAATVNLMFSSNSRAKSIWIDDIQVREVLSDGSLGENILNGGGFEKEVTNLSEKNGVLSWDKDGLYYDYVNIYEKKADGSLELVNESEKVTGTSYLLKDSLGEEKTFVVKTVLSKKAGAVESDGVEITVDGKYQISEVEKFDKVTFADGGFSSLGEGATVEKTLTNLENGNVMASITIINKNGDRKLPVKYFAALYNGETLVDVVMMDKTIDWRGEATLKAVLNIGDVDAGNYKIKTFLWDNGFLPLKAAGEITE